MFSNCALPVTCLLYVVCTIGNCTTLSEDQLAIRQNIETMNLSLFQTFNFALQRMKNNGTFEEIARFHGYPGLCFNGTGDRVSCCVHGPENFPQWHRLYTKQFEDELFRHGWTLGVPYWDWTWQMEQLPDRINTDYFTTSDGSNALNSIFQGQFADMILPTVRFPNISLFNSDHFLNKTLSALAWDDYCQFEAQWQGVHNELHNAVGGNMSDLNFASFDPVFILHHVFVDKIWAIWQALPGDCGRPHLEKDCKNNVMHLPMMPYANSSINHDVTTFNNSRPLDVSDYRRVLNYRYDNLGLNNMTFDQLKEEISKIKLQDRHFVAITLSSIGMSAYVEVYLCIFNTTNTARDCGHLAGRIAIFGGSLEMPSVSRTPYLLDVTPTVQRFASFLNISIEAVIRIKTLDGTYLDPNLLPPPTLYFQKPGAIAETCLLQTSSSCSTHSIHFSALASFTAALIRMAL